MESHQIVSGETIHLRGAFDDKFVAKPVAVVDLRSPHFACHQNIHVKVAVTELSDNLQCINYGVYKALVLVLTFFLFLSVFICVLFLLFFFSFRFICVPCVRFS